MTRRRRLSQDAMAGIMAQREAEAEARHRAHRLVVEADGKEPLWMWRARRAEEASESVPPEARRRRRPAGAGLDGG